MSTATCGIHSIGHFALNVPSLEEAHAFFDCFGLDVRALDNELQLRAADGHVWARIFPGKSKSLAYISFHCHEQDYPILKQQIEALTKISGDGPGRGLWFQDPDGNLLNVRVGEKTMPDAKAPGTDLSVAADQRGATTRDRLPRIQPRRLSHVLLFSPDVPRAVAFYENALGLKLSDHSEDVIAFTHATHGCDHHLVAFAKSSAKGWHHAAWEVASIDEVGVGAAQMNAGGYAEGWGTGRHCLGSNYFHYVRDPWGSFFEYSAEIDFISAGTDWPAGDFPPENSLYLWGPDVPDYFISNTEAS